MPLNKSSATPAQLWIGSQASLIKYVERYLQQIFCTHNACTTCSLCIQIQQRQHYACLWFDPESSYTLDSIKPFFTTIARSLDNQQQFFFIFNHSDYLSIACANSLLKSIEEPPPGYHIIFLAQHLQAVAPTIRSRCTMVTIDANALHETINNLVPFFTTRQTPDFESFMQILDKSALDDRTTLTILEQILDYWLIKYKTAKTTSEQEDNQKIIDALELLNYALQKPPMPGSSKLFWKNLFLKML